MDDTVYRLPTIEDEPFPGGVTIPRDTASVGTGKDTFTPATVPINERFPERLIAHQTISESFDTQSRKILGSYSFGQVGAIAIGEFEDGVSGDIRISPDGIIGRNVNGDTTFSIDGTTGDATFLGTIQAGTLIAGATQVMDDSIVIDGENGRIVFYEAGVPVIIIGEL